MCTISKPIAATLGKTSTPENPRRRGPPVRIPLHHPHFRLSSLIHRLCNTIATTCLLFLGWQYYVPPLQLKEVPVIDSISNCLVVFLLWFCGFSFSRLTLGKALIKGLILSLCVSGVHALDAVMDDIAAGQRTIATALGQRPAAIFSCVC